MVKHRLGKIIMWQGGGGKRLWGGGDRELAPPYWRGEGRGGEVEG